MLQRPRYDNEYYNTKVYNELSADLIFVFGSNLRGIHGAGAAKIAMQDYGAVLGKGEGLYAKSYAIPTKDRHIATLPLEVINRYIVRFNEFTQIASHSFSFYVTPVGTGLAGYKHREIAPMFKGAKNCWFPDVWKSYLNN